MKSRIEKIKQKSNKINVEQLIKTGKYTFDEENFREFEDSFGSNYILNEIYTCYTSNNSLVLECLIKYCCKGGKRPDDLTLSDSDFKLNRDFIYIKGKEVKEIRTEFGMLQEEEDIYNEVQEVIENANKKSIMQKQYIRNFFRNIFKRKNNNLLEGDTNNLTEEEIKDMLASIQEKPKKFIDKYNKEKTKEETKRDKNERKELKYDEESRNDDERNAL